jgi:ribosomal protein L40E
METKICRKCNEDKPLASYWKHKTTADGFYNICKSCEAIKRKPKNAEYSKKWRREQFVKHFYGNARGS